MKYKGIELKRFASDKPVTFDPPKKMVVWNSVEGESSLTIDEVIAYIPERAFHGRKSVICKLELYGNCAEIPEEPKPRRATNRELSKWLAQGNGEWGISKFGVIEKAEIGWFYDTGYEKQTLHSELRVRKWEDSEWHEPTADYLGLE